MSDVEALIGFRKLAEDDAKYTSLLNDSVCLHGLVLLLSNSSREVLITVLQILLTLSKRPNGTSILSHILGLSEQLNSLMDRATCPEITDEDTINILAKDLYRRVFVTHHDRLMEKEPNDPVVPTVNLQPKIVALRLYGVKNDTDLEVVRNALIGIHGVISITFQPQKNRAIIFTVPDMNPEILVQTVRSANSFHRDSDTTKDRTLSETDQPLGKGINARIIRKRSEVSFNKTRKVTSRRESLSVPEMPVYLEENADLFEVDESRAAPKLKTHLCTEDGAKGDGPISWLSSFLERSFFW